MIVNIEKTQEYYRNNIYCNCAECNNFYFQFKNKYPGIYKYLESLGINPLRPFELIPNTLDDGTISYLCEYVVFGSCSEETIASIGNIEITLNNCFHPNTYIEDEHFVISFEPIILENYTLKIEKLSNMINIYNHINGKKNFDIMMEKFYSTIDYIADLQKYGLIETDGVIINKELVDSIFNDEVDEMIKFKDLITNTMYLITLFPRCFPGIHFESEWTKKSFLDLIRYEKKEMNPIRFKINYFFIPIWLAIFFLNILLIVIIDAKNDSLSLTSYILLGIDILSLPTILSSIPFIRKKEVKLELDKYDFVNSNGDLIYEFEDEMSVKSINKIEFLEDKILINNNELNYENCNCMIVTNNHLLRINVNLLFEIWDKNCYEYNISLKLDGKLIKLINDKQIKVLNKDIYDYIIHNKEKAFYQIIKYGSIRRTK